MVFPRCGEQTFLPHFLPFAALWFLPGLRGRGEILNGWVKRNLHHHYQKARGLRHWTIQVVLAFKIRYQNLNQFLRQLLYVPLHRCVLANLEEISCETYLDVQRKSPQHTHTYSYICQRMNFFNEKWFKPNPVYVSPYKKKNNPKDAEFALRVTEEWVVTQRGRGSKTNKIGMKAKQRADCVIEPWTTSLALKWWQFIYLLH